MGIIISLTAVTAIFLCIGITAAYSANMLRKILDDFSANFTYETFQCILEKKKRHDDASVIAFACVLVVLLTILFIGL